MDYGSLFGGMRCTGPRQIAKRAFLDRPLAEVDVLVVQEVRGGVADLGVLPDSHRYYGALLRSDSAGTSAGGGAVSAVRRDVVEHSTDVHFQTLAVGRIVVVSIRAGQWSHFAAVHVDSAQPLSRTTRDLGCLAHALNGLEGVSYLLGNWKSIHPVDARMTGIRVEIDGNDKMGSFFDGVCQDLIARVQHDFTLHRLARSVGVQTMFSTIDRIYCSAQSTAYEDVVIQTSVRGAGQGRKTPSDHVVVIARVSERRGKGRRQVQRRVGEHECFEATFKDELRVYQDIQDPDVRHIALVRAAHACQHRVRTLLLSSGPCGGLPRSVPLSPRRSAQRRCFASGGCSCAQGLCRRRRRRHDTFWAAHGDVP